jgi:hypothetical protein
MSQLIASLAVDEALQVSSIMRVARRLHLGRQRRAEQGCGVPAGFLCMKN